MEGLVIIYQQSNLATLVEGPHFGRRSGNSSYGLEWDATKLVQDYLQQHQGGANVEEDQRYPCLV